MIYPTIHNNTYLFHLVNMFMLTYDVTNELFHLSHIPIDRTEVIVIFYTEILTRKVVLWCFFMSETSERIHSSTFRVKISV